MLTSMSILDGIWAIVGFEVIVDEKRKCLFTISLTGTTMQDGGKRERSDNWLNSNSKFRNKNIKWNKMKMRNKNKINQAHCL